MGRWPIPFSLHLLEEEPTLDPLENLRRERDYLVKPAPPLLRLWRNTDCVVLGRFLKAEEEVVMEEADRLGVPILKRTSGGGAVFHDLGNINYSIYLDERELPTLRIGESMVLLSLPVIRLLQMLDIPWEWRPPNGIFVGGGKMSGSAQARTRGRVLHHGTLLVETDLDKLGRLLKPGGRSRIAPVINLSQVVPGLSVEEAMTLMREDVRRSASPQLTGTSRPSSLT